jgi:hypothetical protein
MNLLVELAAAVKLHQQRVLETSIELAEAAAASRVGHEMADTAEEELHACLEPL